jgi:biopolymer transport protein ExbD
MSGSRIAGRQSRNHARYRGRNDLNIVPMLDVMVILIFFLIFTAVFSKMNILELNLPVDGGSQPQLPAVLELEVIVRGDAIEVADRNTGLLQRLPNRVDGVDYTGLSNYLRRVKIRFPEKKDATVLLEEDTPYDTMVRTMDTMKSFDTELDGQPVRGELFPQIAVGDAPAGIPPGQVALR